MGGASAASRRGYDPVAVEGTENGVDIVGRRCGDGGTYCGRFRITSLPRSPRARARRDARRSRRARRVPPPTPAGSDAVRVGCRSPRHLRTTARREAPDPITGVRASHRTHSWRRTEDRRSTTTDPRATLIRGPGRLGARRRRCHPISCPPDCGSIVFDSRGRVDLDLHREISGPELYMFDPRDAGDAGDVLAAAADGRGSAARPEYLPGLLERRLLLPQQSRPGRDRDHGPSTSTDR